MQYGLRIKLPDMARQEAAVDLTVLSSKIEKEPGAGMLDGRTENNLFFYFSTHSKSLRSTGQVPTLPTTTPAAWLAILAAMAKG